MLKNYVTIAWRGLRKRAGSTFINVTGLAVGLACCLLIGLYVYHEWSYDRFHERADRIYRVAQELRLATTQRVAVTSVDLGPELVETYPEIESTVRFARRSLTVRRDEAAFHDQEWLYADAALFSVFTFPLLQGDAETALAAPHTVVLTESAARRYFGDDDPVGQTIALGTGPDAPPYTVTGVASNPPSNSHLRFDGLISFVTTEAALSEGQRRASMFWTYVLLRPGASPRALERQFPDFVNRLGPDASEQLSYELQPLTDIHLHSDLLFDNGGQGNAETVSILAMVALFMLLIASVNYVNLSTARAGDRAREVGVRKVVGAHRRTLVAQFLTESVVLTALAVLLGLGLARLAMPAFSSFTGAAVADSLPPLPAAAAGLAGVVLLLGLLAGSYPALLLSRFQPADVLKGGPARAGGRARFRQGLVVLQFGLTTLLLAATLVTFRQLDFVREADLGMDLDRVVSVAVPGGAANVERLQEAWAAVPGVQATTAAAYTGVGGTARGLLGREGMEEPLSVNWIDVAADYPAAMGIDVVAGRGFSAEMASDSVQAILLNEAAVRALGWASPEEALGQDLTGVGGRVAGVVADFHFASFHETISPLVLRWRPQGLNRILARLDARGLPETLAALEASWKTVVPAQPFAYAFLADVRDELYADERRLGQVFGLFALLAVVVACLGLFGLAAYAAEQRRKEVGVRKVLGASTRSIVGLFAREFLALVAMAFVLGAPVAYLAMDRWLDGFAYRTSVGAGVFAVVALLLVLVTMLTVGYQSLRAARANPVESLRYE